MGTCSRCKCVCLFCGSFIFLIDICQTFLQLHLNFSLSTSVFFRHPPSLNPQPYAVFLRDCTVITGLYALAYTLSLPHTSATLPAGLLCSPQTLQYAHNFIYVEDFIYHGRLHPSRAVWLQRAVQSLCILFLLFRATSCICTLLNKLEMTQATTTVYTFYYA